MEYVEHKFHTRRMDSPEMLVVFIDVGLHSTQELNGILRDALNKQCQPYNKRDYVAFHP